VPRRPKAPAQQEYMRGLNSPNLLDRGRSSKGAFCIPAPAQIVSFVTSVESREDSLFAGTESGQGEGYF
jgi:hypothetical protein